MLWWSRHSGSQSLQAPEDANTRWNQEQAAPAQTLETCISMLENVARKTDHEECCHKT